jgi:hypothetical protein
VLPVIESGFTTPVEVFGGDLPELFCSGTQCRARSMRMLRDLAALS